MLSINHNNFKTTDEVKALAPSIFCQKPLDGLSSKYSHIPTSKIIDDMDSLGWKVVDAREVKARYNKGFQKHLIVFRNPDIMINGENNDVVYPQILLTNSHDGKNSFAFTAGLFRLICENGLVISTQQFESIKLRHFGYTFDELQDKIHSIVNRLPLTVESMNLMKSIKLEQEQIIEFAKKAVEVRFGELETKRITINYADLVSATRPEDEGDDLWSIFNVIQEKIISGDFNYVAGNKSRKARKIKNFNQDIKVNQQLFDLALEYSK
jgi:hypothetical protein